MNGLTGKVWGTTEAVIATPFCEAHRLTIKPEHQCSMHRHERKWNAFLVVSGRLFIDVAKTDYPLVDVTELGPGDMMSVPPGEKHRFRTGSEPCVAVEFYYPDVLGADIVRDDHGGPTTA